MGDRKDIERKNYDDIAKDHASHKGPANKTDRDSGQFVSFDKPVPTEKPKKD